MGFWGWDTGLRGHGPKYAFDFVEVGDSNKKDTGSYLVPYHFGPLTRRASLDWKVCILGGGKPAAPRVKTPTTLKCPCSDIVYAWPKEVPM